MKKFLFFFLLLSSAIIAQPGTQFTQNGLNVFALNPAESGNTKGLNFLVGRRTQWTQISLAPVTNFGSVTKDFGRKGFRRYWHGAGAYVENERYGVFDNKALYANYSIHLKLNPRYHVSFGLFAGIRQFSVDNNIYLQADPAYAPGLESVVMPDFIPGISLYSRKISAGLSIRNLYSNKLSDGRRTVGSGNVLEPVAYGYVNMKLVSGNYDFITIPAIQLQSSLVRLPVAQVSVISYFRRRIGAGIAYRSHSSVSLIIQARILSNVVVGFAYDHTIGKVASIGANSVEYMMGFSPVMSATNYERPGGAVECPRFEL